MPESELLRTIPIFKNFTDTEYREMLQLLKKKEYAKNEVVCSHEESGDSLYIIKMGRVKISLYSESGKEIILSMMKDGDFFGEMSLLDSEPRSANVIAVEKSELYILERNVFVSYLMKSPALALKILRIMSHRLRIADEQIGNLALLDVYGRIARYMIQLAKTEGEDCEDGKIIKVLPTHQEIAGLVGTSRETVSRALSDFNRKHIIRYQNKSVVISSQALNSIVEKYSY